MINHFGNPSAFWLLMIIPPFVYWELFKPRPTLSYSDTTMVGESLPPQHHWNEIGLLVLKSLALIFLIIALACPQTTLKQKQVFRNGVDMMVALDASESMAAEDLQPYRLASSKKIIQSFITQRENDRMGLIVFGERAIMKAPLTFDHELLINLIEKVKVGEAGSATAIGQAMVNALNRLRDSEAKSKLIILLTDGENNAGAIDPLEAAKLAKAIGVRVYTIGIGSAEGAPMPIIDAQGVKQYARLPDGTLVLTKLHPEALITIADMTGGRYYQAQSTAQLQSVFQSIDQLEKVKLKTNMSVQYQDRVELFIIFGLIALLTELILGQTLWRVFP